MNLNRRAEIVETEPKFIRISPNLCNSHTENSPEASLCEISGEFSVLSYLVTHKLVAPGSVIFDVGANVGEWTKGLLKFDFRYKVHLFEAVPHTYNELQKILAEEIRDGNLVLNNCALGKEEALSPFYYYEDTPSWSTFYRRYQIEREYNLKPPKTINVNTLTIDKYCKQHEINQISLLKIDVEGAELDVLRGAEQLLKKNKIDLIQFEYGGTFKDADIRLEEVFKLLNYSGFAVFKIIPQGLQYYPQYQPQLEDYNYSNYLATNTHLKAIILNDSAIIPNSNEECDEKFVRSRNGFQRDPHANTEISPPTVTMSTLGKNGRFANQIFQYAFLKIYAQKHDLRVETPSWIGQYLFGHTDPPISRKYPIVKQETFKLSEDPIANTDKPFENVDFWGYFQYHTSYYALQKEYFRSLFTPTPGIAAKMTKALDLLCSKGKTIVGLHLRRGDYGYGHFFVAPSDWYKEWLHGFWETLDKPVLYIASDESEIVVDDFKEFQPITSNDLGVTLPEAEYYVDFYILTQCDALAISNSSFSFAASMLNKRAKYFFRPHLHVKKLIPYDPWNSETIFRDQKVETKKQKAEIIQNCVDILNDSYLDEKLDGSYEQKSTTHDRQEYPDKNTHVFFLNKRESYRPVMFSTSEVFWGPDCKTTLKDNHYVTLKTPSGSYDIEPFLEKLPPSQIPELIVVKADSTGRNYPDNLSCITCPKLLILGNTQHLKMPLQSLIRYALREKFDFIVSDHKRHHLHYFKEAGFQKVAWFPGLNVYPYMQPYYDQKDHDISFVGQAGIWHPYRKHIIQHLKSNGINLNVFQLTQAKAAEMYARSLINLNVSLNGDLNLRIFEVLSSGGFLITDKLSVESGLELLFKDGQHLVCFENEKNLLEKVRYYLKHPEEAKAIARNGYEEYLRHHTPEKKIQELMDWIDNDKINPLYDIDLDNRSLNIKSKSAADLLGRVAVYEFFQELHLNKPRPTILIYPEVDSRLVCDIVDLPRLNFCIKNDGSEISRESLLLFENSGLMPRIQTKTGENLRNINRPWDAVILSASEINNLGIENVLQDLNTKWLVIVDGLDSLAGEDQKTAKDALAALGFQKRSDEIDAYYWKKRFMYGEFLFSENRIGEAIQCFKSILEDDPSNHEALNNLGVISYKLNDLDTAIDFLNMALSLDRRNRNTLINLAIIYLNLAHYRKAADLFEQLTLLENRNPSWWFHLGFCYEKLNRNPEAQQAYLCSHNLQNNPASDRLDPAQDVNKPTTAFPSANPKPLLSPRKILVINNLYPPQELGGYGRLLCDFANLLKARGHSIYVLTSDTPYLGSVDPNEPDVDRRLVLFGSWENGRCKPIDEREKINLIADQNRASVRHIVEDFSPDLCLLGNIDFLSHRVMQPLFESRIPVIHHLGNQKPGYAVQDTPNSRFYHLATASRWLKNQILKQGYALDDISVVYPGALAKEFNMPVLPAVDRLRIVFAGIILPYKGPHLLIQALKRLHDNGINFTCTLAGTTTNQRFVKRLKDFIHACGMDDKIKFVGHLAREDLKNLFAKHNVLVFPSFVEEAFGISQVEAMAAGLTVVTSGTGGAREIVEHGVSGIIFKSQNDESLAAELLRLNQDKTRWRQIAACGQKRAGECFDIECSVDLLEKKFAQMLSEKQASTIHATAHTS